MKTLIATAISSALLLSACSEPSNTTTNNTAQNEQVSASIESTNPLFVKSPLQFQTPQFDLIKDEHFVPAFEQGMKEQLAEIDAIVNNTEAPSFENTIVAMEKSGELLTRASRIFFNLNGTDSNDARRAIQTEMAPKFAAHGDNINLNKALFERVEAVYNQRAALNLTAEEKRLVEVLYKGFVRSGAKLNEDQKARIREINKALSTIGTQFSQNIMALIKNNVVIVEDKAQLAGLSDAQIASLATAAAEAGHEGKYLIKITNTTRQPILASLENRDLREKVWRASAERALTGENSNADIVPTITKLRAERAALLGYDSYAHFGLESQMAKEPQAVLDMLSSMVPALLQNVDAEAAAIQAKIDASGENFKLAPWDWFFYAEQVRKDKYNLDENAVKEYFEFNRVLKDGVFFTMNRLYGITFKPRPDLPVYHEDVEAYELLDEDGSSLAIFYADYFAREGKRGGAWKSAFVKQSGLDNQRPVIVNVMNIQKAPEGEPTLISYSEATTIFHEMGHGVHGMLSQVKYPTLSGTSTSRDFVEFPSTFEEDWAMYPEVIANYAKHYKTGEPIPKDLLKKVIESRSFNQGFDTFEYVAAALLDMEWHSLPASAPKQDIVKFEQAALEKHNVNIDYIPPRYKSAYFNHSMGGYAAGYYAYMWSEILAADAYAYVQTQGGLNRKIGQKYRENILEVGNTRDLMESYKAFRGQEPTTEALLKRRGLSVTVN
ncbi:M3 family metallopeptidase [Pseudoalteromonas phenolica]|uniref:Dipeptidyl carboxypeptidase II n=1 Tax=Pseudoalteromonas phenolica TaxID=161398 RepID=A0A0S2K0R1_9GAMM|nr:M3 family metallopeptidase [Pseudoalteromonas phenolica]ALO41684.1 Dipeptidyl carboxypeptidase II [Pseudoalteromonas phenolica]MBE0353765.1 peptidyl-dipeptidase Dcp [Pseudoalteromonas phenolica O-BC30]RXE94467.1 dipeptidyl carboxypeptidase II [Pseudoalteromonas phenolica O-BC30]